MVSHRGTRELMDRSLGSILDAEPAESKGGI
jgi:hypothetical protein